MLNPRRSWRVILSLALALGLGMFSLRFLDISFREIIKALSRFSPTFVISALALLLCQNSAVILRYWILIPRKFKVGARDAGYAGALAQLANGVLPARAGDALKVVLLGRAGAWGTSLPMAAGAGVVTSEKIVDISSMALLAVLLKVHSVPNNLMPRISPWAIVLSFAAFSLVVLGITMRARKNPAGKLAQTASRFVDGMCGVFNPKTLVLGLVMGLIVWSSESVAVVLLSHSQGYPFSLAQAFFGLIVLNVLIAVPISVANVGAYEASLAFGLNLVGMDTVAAIAVATALHMLQLINISFIALVCVVSRRIALRRVHDGKKGFRTIASPAKG